MNNNIDNKDFYCIGIIWNVANDYYYQIIKYLASSIQIIGVSLYFFENDYCKFVKDLYKTDFSTDSIKKEYLISKIKRMEESSNRTFLSFIGIISSPQYSYNFNKKKEYCQQVRNLKDEVRNKFSSEIENYVYDVLLHMSDNEKEMLEMFKTFKNYDNMIVEKLINEDEYSKFLSFTNVHLCSEKEALEKTGVNNEKGRTRKGN